MEIAKMLDPTDRKILLALQENVSISTTDLAARIGLSQASSGWRIQRLEETGVISKRPRLSLFLGVAAAYHVTCWSTSGRTLGGLVMRQRVVAVDGSRPTVGQSLVRLVALPFGWARGRPVQDVIACTDVIKD